MHFGRGSVSISSRHFILHFVSERETKNLIFSTNAKCKAESLERWPYKMGLAIQPSTVHCTFIDETVTILCSLHRFSGKMNVWDREHFTD